MKSYDLMNILGRAFAYGIFDNLNKYLSEGCEYTSEYSNKHIITSKEIIKWMEKVNYKIESYNRYTFKLVPIKDILKKDNESVKKQVNSDESLIATHLSETHNGDLEKKELTHKEIATIDNEYVILLFQHQDKYPVAVVSIERELKTGKITKILLSRNSEIYNIDFYRADMGDDSPLDHPSTVKPLTHEDILRKEYLSLLSGQIHDEEKEDLDENLYIWRKADEFMKDCLPQLGYKLYESKVFDDCIGYKTVRNNFVYTIYMFAYGKKRTIKSDVEYYNKFFDYEMSRKSTVLIVYVNVKRYRIGNDIEYEFFDYVGNKFSLEFWHLTIVKEKTILLYYPRREMIETSFKLNDAFNNDSLDLYDCTVSKDNFGFFDYKKGTKLQSNALYKSLCKIHKEYGDMNCGFVSFNGFIYSLVNYINNYGYFFFKVDNKTNKIIEITSRPLIEKNNKVKDFIKTYEKGSISIESFPKLIKVETFPPVDTERFALKLYYDNGECKKYVLPIKRQYEKDVSVYYKKHIFTDKIWQSAKISDDCLPEIKGYSNRLPKIIFDNGFFLSSLYCYYVGNDYSEPELTNDIVYEDDKCILKRIWKWEVNSVREDQEYDYNAKGTGLLKVLMTGFAFNYYSTSTYMTKEGKRLCSIDFDYISDFSEGYARVVKKGYGYGFIDANMNFKIPMQYEYAEDFVNGYAKIKQNDNWYLIDSDNKKIEFKSKIDNKKYQEIAEYYEGMCRVSTLKPNLAYHSDYDEIAGIWGFINEKGEEVIAPQYIYAYDFKEGIAIVCKGKWTIDKKWDNKYNQGRCWTETELWGAIDKDGNEVIPFIFDELKYFYDINEAFIVHYGGWEKGKWGVIDKRGKWLAEPIFEDIDCEFFDGMFAFYKDNCDGCVNDDDVRLGIYDTNQQKIIFEPQFLDVSFLEDGWIEVEVFDEKSHRKITKIIDKNGKEKFHSEYSSISGLWRNEAVLEVTIEEKDGDKNGLIDRNGKVLYPCEKNIEKFYYEKRLIIFKDKDKVGLKDFDGKIIIPPNYSVISNLDKDFYSVEIKEDNIRREGLINPEGKVIVPTEFERISWLRDGKHIICCRDGFCQMLEYIEKK